MKPKPELAERRCHCGAMAFEITLEDAVRYDTGEAGLRCGNACWGIFLARNANKETGKL